tara:strand:+ start:86 stop:655 length:570 start_codon:yes stop_codon:yes gene_type:complete
MEPEVLRAVERILIISFAGISIILGWHLFKIGVLTAQKAEFSGKGFTAKLLNVGPGVFFSLFGSTVLSVALVNGLNIKQTDTQSDGEEITVEYQYLNAQSKFRFRDLTRSINTLEHIDIKKSSPFRVHRDGIFIAIENLKNYRDYLLRQKFKKEDIEEYFACLEDSQDEMCNQTDKIKEISTWLTETTF